MLHLSKIFRFAYQVEFCGYKGIRGKSHGLAESTLPNVMVAAES